MSLIKYKVTELPLEQLSFNSELKEKDKRLIESFSVNENFIQANTTLAYTSTLQKINYYLLFLIT